MNKKNKDETIFLLFQDRNDRMHIFDSSIIPHLEEGHALIDLAASVMLAGYQGVDLDAFQISDGRHFITVQINEHTPEGTILKKLEHDFMHGKPLPSSAELVENITGKYEEQGGSGSSKQ